MPYKDKNQQKEFQKNWKRSKIRALQALKEGKPCTDCGIAYPHYVMQWDHLPEHKKFKNVNRMFGYSWHRIIAEIAKCELVCANCHAARTYERSSRGTVLVNRWAS